MPQASTAEILRAEQILFDKKQVVELRILNTRRGTVAGYFDDFEKLAESAGQWSGKAPGIYFTLNPVDPALLARSVNRVVEFAKQTTADNNILSRRWLPIDLDPVRPAGISANRGRAQFSYPQVGRSRRMAGSTRFPDAAFRRQRERRASAL